MIKNYSSAKTEKKSADQLKLERLQEELADRCGGQPTLTQWAAAAAGVDQKTLRRRLNYGILCKDKMIKSNIYGLLFQLQKNYQGAGMNLQDLVQEGCQGLVRGAEKFDASKGFKFSTYAHWWIKQAVRKSLSDQPRTISLPFHMVEATFRVKEARKQLYRENGRQPDNEEVAEATGLSMKRLTAVLLSPRVPWSLAQKIGINQNLKPSEVIADPEEDTAEDMLIKQFMKKDLEKVLDSSESKRKKGAQMEVRNGERKDENFARNRGVNGCKQRKNPANRVMRFTEVEEQKENRTSAAIFAFICHKRSRIEITDGLTGMHS